MLAQSKTAHRLKFEVELTIGYSLCTRTGFIDVSEYGYSLADWQQLKEQEREDVLEQITREWAMQYVEYYVK